MSAAETDGLLCVGRADFDVGDLFAWHTNLATLLVGYPEHGTLGAEDPFDLGLQFGLIGRVVEFEVDFAGAIRNADFDVHGL